MPFSTAARVLLNPRFARRLSVMRRTQTTDDHGRLVTTEAELNPAGIIHPGSLQQVVQDAEGQFTQRQIVVHAYAFTLLDAQTGFSPDVLIYRGNRYQVRKVYDWSDYGPGFTSADCDIMAPEPDPNPPEAQV